MEGEILNYKISSLLGLTLIIIFFFLLFTIFLSVKIALICGMLPAFKLGM